MYKLYNIVYGQYIQRFYMMDYLSYSEEYRVPKNIRDICRGDEVVFYTKLGAWWFKQMKLSDNKDEYIIIKCKD